MLAPAFFRRGLICRAADRGYPVIQLAPPLIAGRAEFAQIGAILSSVLEDACRWLKRTGDVTRVSAHPAEPHRRDRDGLGAIDEIGDRNTLVHGVRDAQRPRPEAHSGNTALEDQ